jgi:hypothetical protein
MQGHADRDKAVIAVEAAQNWWQRASDHPPLVRQQPDTEVLSTITGFERDYARDPYAGYDKVQRLMFDVQHRDERLPLKEWVLGITIGAVAKAYPFSALASRVDAAGVLRDRVGGQEIEIRFSREHRSAHAFDRAGSRLPA